MHAIKMAMGHAASFKMEPFVKLPKCIYYKHVRRTHLLPPLFFRGASSGLGNGFTCLTGGGSCILSNFFCISSFSATQSYIRTFYSIRNNHDQGFTID